METNFFTSVAALNIQGDMLITLQPQQDGSIMVSVLLSNDDVTDPAARNIAPMNLHGLPPELDAGFFAAIEKPVQKTIELFTNMREYDIQLEETRKASKATQAQEQDTKKNQSDKEKKYLAKMEKVKELEEKERFREAIGQLPKEADFPEYAEDIKAKLVELRSKAGELFLQ